MNLDKLSVTLCMAFQESDGPFDVLIMFEGGMEEAVLSKEEIKVLSDQELTIFIDITQRQGERRALHDLRWNAKANERRK